MMHLLASGIGRLAAFRVRSEGRDRQAELSVVTPVLKALDQALSASRAEREGLDRRVADAVAAAAMMAGNGTDEYIERDTVDNSRLREYEGQIASGQKRLERLDYIITQLQWLEAELLTRLTPAPSTQGS